MDNIFIYVIIVSILFAVFCVKIWLDIKSIHTIVNSQRAQMQEQIDHLWKLVNEGLQREAVTQGIEIGKHLNT